MKHVVRIRSPQDFGAAVFFILLGAAGLWFGWEYRTGTISEMGPGYVPRLLGFLLIGFGIVIGLRSLTLEGPPIEPVSWRPLVLVLIAITAFALLIDSAGLAIAIFAVTVVSAFASSEARWKETVALGVVLAVSCVLVFVYALKQSIPVFWGE